MISFLLDIYEKTGVVLFPLLLLAVFGWFYLIDTVRFLYFEGELKINDFFKKKKGSQNTAYCQNQISLFVLKYIENYHHHLNTVKFIAGLAPLLGLLGTVNGMVQTFTVISLYGSSNPIFLADGISEALITTQMGLAISFPLLFFRVLVYNKLQEIPVRLENRLLAD